MTIKEAIRARGIHRLPNFSGHSNVLLPAIQAGKEIPGSQAVRVYVKKKVPLSELKPEEVIPTVVTVDGVDYSTDVVVLDAKALSAPVPPLKAKTRPLSLGYSFGHYLITAGTLGAVVYVGGQPYFLTNNHVAANQSTIQNTRAHPGDAILQPGPYDGGQTSETDAGDASASMAIPILLDETGINQVDSTLSAPLRPELVDDVYGPPINSSLTGFKTTYAAGDQYQYLGRTSGYKKVTVSDPSANLSVAYETFNAQFEDVVVFSPAAIPGDSGSGMLTMDNELGLLLFAGDQASDTGIGCKISNVLAAYQKLGIVLDWRGPPPPPPLATDSVAFVSWFLNLPGTPNIQVDWQGGTIASPLVVDAWLILKDGSGQTVFAAQAQNITIWPKSQNHVTEAIYLLLVNGAQLAPGTYTANTFCITPSNQVVSLDQTFKVTV